MEESQNAGHRAEQWSLLALLLLVPIIDDLLESFRIRNQPTPLSHPYGWFRTSPYAASRDFPV